MTLWATISLHSASCLQIGNIKNVHVRTFFTLRIAINAKRKMHLSFLMTILCDPALNMLNMKNNSVSHTKLHTMFFPLWWSLWQWLHVLVRNSMPTRTHRRRVKTLGQHQVGVNLQSHAQHQLWISTWHIFHEFHKNNAKLKLSCKSGESKCNPC